MKVLNELNYAEQCLKDGIIGDNPFFTLSILAKYYYHHLGYRKKKIVEELTKFLHVFYPRYRDSKTEWDDTIEKLATNCKKYPLHEIYGIWITESELEKIKKINDKVLERLAFTLLCLAKLGVQKSEKANGWVNDDTKAIFTLARISGSVLDRNIRIGQLAKLGIVELPKKNDSQSIRVTIIDNDSKNTLFIQDFRELGYEYLLYRGENIIRCAECGILTRGNKNGSKRYCSSCSGYIPQETKTITCVDCGKEVVVHAKNNKTCRCEECQAEQVRRQTRERMRQRRADNVQTEK